MAWYDDALKFSWPTVLVVVGVAVLVPVFLPALGYMVRPLVKGVVKTGLTVKDMAVGFVEETGEQVSDLVAEAKAEHYARPEA
ncbi:MAG: DUF5132 domain-containing protein [Desulfobaccales bacterium]|jgi:hypothetical protein